MRPVVPEEIGDLLKWRPLMLLNITLLGPAYVESMVSYSPAVIASQGGRRLPLEIWYMIIDFSKCSPENHRYSLVRPKTSARGGELVCKRYQRWSPFGNIKQHEEIEMYHFYLAHPDKLHHPVLDLSCPNPFYFPSPSFGSLCAFPTALLASKTKFLYVALTVPDVIKNLEDGYCTCCSGKHVVGSDFVVGSAPQWSRFWELLGRPVSALLAGFFICPLCVGPEHTWDSIDRHRTTPLSRRKYNSWLLDRIESLGLNRPRWEDVPHSIEHLSRSI